MILESRSLPDLWTQAEGLLLALSSGRATPSQVVGAWRKVVDTEPDRVRRAEAMINLATALDFTGEAGTIQAIAVADRALEILGPKHHEAAGAYFTAAQRLMSPSTPEEARDDRKALDYLHLAMAVPVTAPSRDVLVALLVRYALAVDVLGDFTRLDKAQHIFERLRKVGVAPDETYRLLGAMAAIHQSHWTATARVPSLRKAIALSAEAVALVRKDDRGDAPGELSNLLQQQAIMVLERHRYSGAEADRTAAADLLREAVEHSRRPAAIFNSLAVALMGTDADPAPDVAFEEARAAIVDGLRLATQDDELGVLRWTEANWNLAAYWRGGPVSHLDRAVEAAGLAAEDAATLGEGPLFTLASVLYNRYRVGREVSDIDRAVEAVERGLQAGTQDQADRWSHEVTAANIFHERAVTHPAGFDPVDSGRAIALQTAALGRLKRGSALYNDVASTALGALLEHYVKTRQPQTYQAMASLAHCLPDTPGTAADLSAISKINLAAFYLQVREDATDRDGWIKVLWTVARSQPKAEAGWLAASSLMHLHAGKDWTTVLAAYELIARQRSLRLSGARTPRDRAMVLRREQNVAAIAALALAHLGRPSKAAQLIDSVQATLLTRADPPEAPDERTIWTVCDALIYPAATRYGAFVVTLRPDSETIQIFSELAIDPAYNASPSGVSTLTVASTLLEAAFGKDFPERLLIVPVGALTRVAWPMVPVGSATLIDACRLSVLPTRRLWRGPLGARLDTLLVVDASLAVSGAPLRHARAEVSQLREWLPHGEDLKGNRATPAVASVALADTDVAHFAAHGITDPADPLRSHLALADGVLSVQDILDLDGRSLSLVSLSACQSAVHGNGLPDEFSSLAVAFLAAGARFTVGTLWNLNDAAASLFSRRLFQHLREGVFPPDAVRMAQLWLRDSADAEKARWLAGLEPATSEAELQLRNNLAGGGSRKGFSEPRHWAGFVCYG